MIYRRVKYVSRDMLLATAARISKRKSDYNLERKLYRVIGTGKYGLPESEVLYASHKNEATAMGKKLFGQVFIVEQIGAARGQKSAD